MKSAWHAADCYDPRASRPSSTGSARTLYESAGGAGWSAARAGAISRGYIKLNGLVATWKNRHRDIMPRFRHCRAAYRSGHRDMHANFVGQLGDGIKFHVVWTIGLVAG